MRKDNLRKLKNVVGLVEDDEDNVIVLVNEKLDLDTIESFIANPDIDWERKDIVPELVETKKHIFQKSKKKETKVVEIGHVGALLADKKKYNPLQAGCQIGPKGENFYGTAGLIVKMETFRGIPMAKFSPGVKKLINMFELKTEKKRYVLTNLHVVAKDILKPKKGVIMVQPAITKREIGIVSHFKTMSKKRPNRFDVALIEIDDDVDTLPGIINIGSLVGVEDVAKDVAVRKYGATTRLTKNNSFLKNVSINVDYYEENGEFRMEGMDWFKDLSLPGDSGSVIVLDPDNVGVSLLFAGSSIATFGVPLKRIFEEYGLELVR